MKIVIPGGSGQIGQILARFFHRHGDEVVVLRRHAGQARDGAGSTPWSVVSWDGLRPGPWVNELEGSDVCINLVGRSVNCRYNQRNRRDILQSRVQSTSLLQEAIASLRKPPRVWLNASTATIYRHAFDRPMDEETGELGGSEPGVPDTWKFSIQVAREWESAFFSREIPGVRKVAMRSAITMSPDRGGAFDVLLGLARAGLGGSQGSGQQYVSWIHDRDFVRAVQFFIAEPSMSGVVNLASPNPLPNREFMKGLRQAYGISFGLPLPRLAVEFGAIVKRTESELVFKSRRVVPSRLLAAGFSFEHPVWPEAACDLVQRWKERHARKQEDDSRR